MSSDNEWSEEETQKKVSLNYETYECIQDYIPEDKDCLTLIKYDIVYVFEKDPSGWWKGESLGVCGKFPSHHVRKVIN